MLFTKSYWVNVTEKIEVLPIIHDVRLALREAQVPEGVLTIYLPDGRGGVILAPEGLDKDRDFARWLKEWTEPKSKKEEPPQAMFLSHLFSASLSLPVINGEMDIDVRSALYLVDFTDTATRREFRVTLFSESPKEKPQPGRGR